MSIPFDDQRLPEMLFRYRARNWPDSLSNDEQEQWQLYRHERLTHEASEKVLTLPRYFKTIKACREDEHLTEKQQQVLNELEAYGQQLKNELC